MCKGTRSWDARNEHVNETHYHLRINNTCMWPTPFRPPPISLRGKTKPGGREQKNKRGLNKLVTPTNPTHWNPKDCGSIQVHASGDMDSLRTKCVVDQKQGNNCSLAFREIDAIPT